MPPVILAVGTALENFLTPALMGIGLSASTSVVVADAIIEIGATTVRAEGIGLSIETAGLGHRKL